MVTICIYDARRSAKDLSLLKLDSLVIKAVVRKEGERERGREEMNMNDSSPVQLFPSLLPIYFLLKNKF